MEIRVEALSDWQVPLGCCVCVRVGDSLKQRKLNQQIPAKYRFNALENPRRAKIDVYQLMGTCTVPLDPCLTISDEVTIASSDPSNNDMKLRVTASPHDAAAAELFKQQQQIDDEESRGAAMGYLGSHKVEERLGEAVRALLRLKPADPFDFLCRQLKKFSTPLHTPAPTRVVPPPPGNPEDSAVQVLPNPSSPAPARAVPPAARNPEDGAVQVPPTPSSPPRGHQSLIPPHRRHMDEQPPLLQPQAAFQLHGLQPPNDMSDAEAREVERVLSHALIQLEGALEGDYFPLPASDSCARCPAGTPPEESDNLLRKGLSFSAPVPAGRGIFLSHELELAVWINEARAHAQVLLKPGLSSDEVDQQVETLVQALQGSLQQAGYALVPC